MAKSDRTSSRAVLDECAPIRINDVTTGAATDESGRHQRKWRDCARPNEIVVWNDGARSRPQRIGMKVTVLQPVRVGK